MTTDKMQKKKFVRHCAALHDIEQTLQYTKSALRARVAAEAVVVVQRVRTTGGRTDRTAKRNAFLDLFTHTPIQDAVFKMAAFEAKTSPPKTPADEKRATQLKTVWPKTRDANSDATWRSLAPVTSAIVDEIRETQRATDLTVGKLLKNVVVVALDDDPLSLRNLTATLIALVDALDAKTTCAVVHRADLTVDMLEHISARFRHALQVHQEKLKRLGLRVKDGSPPSNRCLGEFEPDQMGRAFLGKGTYGAVIPACLYELDYETQVETSDCNFAIKKIAINSATPLYRFEDEAALAQQMSSAGVGPLYVAHWHCNDVGYIVTDKWDESLRSTMRRLPVSKNVQQYKRVARLLRQKVERMHALGIAHTDLLPKNVLVRFGASDSRIADVSITDWGLAQAIGGVPHVTPQRMWKYYEDNPSTERFSERNTPWDIFQRPQDSDNALPAYLETLVRNAERAPQASNAFIPWRQLAR